MEYILSLSQITPADYPLIGVAASNITAIKNTGIKIPIGVVIVFEAFDTFLTHNNINLDTDPITLVRKILEGKIPPDLNNELKEVYESLMIGTNKDITMSHKQMLQTIPSPTYNTNTLHYRQAPITTYEELLMGIKKTWASCFAPQEIENENYPGTTEFKLATAILSMNDAEAHVKVDVNNSDDIQVSAYYGEYDPEARGEDIFVVGKEFLQIKNSKITFQDTKLIRRGNRIERTHITPTGSNQKIDDKRIMECARLAKKAHNTMQKPLSITFSLLKEKIEAIHCELIKEDEKINQTPEEEFDISQPDTDILINRPIEENPEINIELDPSMNNEQPNFDQEYEREDIELIDDNDKMQEDKKAEDDKENDEEEQFDDDFIMPKKEDENV